MQGQDVVYANLSGEMAQARAIVDAMHVAGVTPSSDKIIEQQTSFGRDRRIVPAEQQRRANRFHRRGESLEVRAPLPHVTSLVLRLTDDAYVNAWNATPLNQDHGSEAPVRRRGMWPSKDRHPQSSVYGKPQEQVTRGNLPKAIPAPFV
jgi:hypothetical protein